MLKTQRSLLIEALIVWTGSILVARFLYQLRVVPFIENNLMVLTSGIFIYIPVLVLAVRKEPFDFFEQNLPAFYNSIKITFFVSFLIFPVFLFFNHFYQIYFFHFHYHTAPNLRLLNVFLFHLFLVAFPEEFFFRGYLFKRFKQVFQDQKTFMGVVIGKAFFLTAFLFAISHSIIVLRWWHFSIFFPALVFGWLKEKTQGLTAPILFHAFCNVFSTWVGLHYR
jgi:membrane protease YdiL (CAAX protease family)